MDQAQNHLQRACRGNAKGPDSAAARPASHTSACWHNVAFCARRRGSSRDEARIARLCDIPWSGPPTCGLGQQGDEGMPFQSRPALNSTRAGRRCS